MKEVQYSVVIPVYNSGNSIEEVVHRIIHIFDTNNLIFEIILVDDCSKDNSLEKLNELSVMDGRIKLISLKYNSGQQKATVEGIKLAFGKFIITMDDDLEHTPEDIILLINEINKGYDVVYGIVHRKKYPVYRKAGSRLVDLFFNVFMKKPKNIRVSSFRIIRKEITDILIKDNTPYIYISAMLYKITRNMGNVEVKAGMRKYGISNYNKFKLIKLFFKLVYYYGFNNNKITADNRRNTCDY